MVEWSIAALPRGRPVRSIVVACPPGHVHELGRPMTRRRSTAAPPAPSRLPTPWQAVGTELVAIHDAARPLVTPELVEGVVATLAPTPRPPARSPPPPSPTRSSGSSAGAMTHLRRRMDASAVIGRPWIGASCGRRRRLRSSGSRRCGEALDGRSRSGRGRHRRGDADRGGGGRGPDPPAPAENLKVTTPLDLRLAELLLAER